MMTTSNCASQASEGYMKRAFKIKSLDMSVQENRLEVSIKSPYLKSNFYTASLLDDQIVLKIYHLNYDGTERRLSINPTFSTHFISLPKNNYTCILYQEMSGGILSLTLGKENKTQELNRLHYSGVA